MNKKTLKSIGRMILCVLPFAIVGGFFTGVYTLEHSTDEMTRLIYEQVQSPTIFYIITTIQSAMYAVLATAAGYLLADRLGLIKPFRFQKELLKKTVPVIILFGILFASDYFVFGHFIPEVAADYEKGISVAYFLCSLTYGGVIEELLLRWFFMSLIAWILVMIFARKTEKSELPDWIFIVANIIAATAFAAGHLPATIMLFGQLTPLILIRCFLLNGCFALLFGRYYRKYGIQYAMLGHFGLHLVSRLILIIFI